MAGPATLLIFGVACAPACAATAQERAALEKETVRVLVERGFAVKPAPIEAARPTGQTASPDPVDEALKHGADRLLVLDLEANERVLWLTHFARGFAGPWLIQQVVCARNEGRLECPELARVLSTGFRPRRAEDVDLVSALRAQARLVGACMLEEDRVAIDQRIFGRVELDLRALPTGKIKVDAVAPAHVARANLGRCLKNAMEAIDVGPFEGEPIKLRIPIDLD